MSAVMAAFAHNTAIRKEIPPRKPREGMLAWLQQH